MAGMLMGVNTYVALRKLSVTIQLTSPKLMLVEAFFAPGKGRRHGTQGHRLCHDLPSYVLYRVLPMESGKGSVSWHGFQVARAGMIGSPFLFELVTSYFIFFCFVLFILT